jgi:hypothetical protein
MSFRQEAHLANIALSRFEINRAAVKRVRTIMANQGLTAIPRCAEPRPT